MKLFFFIIEVSVLSNRSRTVQSMFNWFYWGINLGALSSLITTNVEKYHSFWLAYMIPLIVFNGAILVLTIGRRSFIQVAPQGSLLLRACHVIKIAIQKRWKLGKQDPAKHFLDYAKDDQTTEKDDTNQFIDELKQAMRVCRVFLFFPFYHICYNQMINNLISQAAQMNVGKRSRRE